MREKKTMLNNKQYDIVKWVVAIVLPAFTTLVATVGATVGWPSTELATTILTAVTTFLGSVFMISSFQYNKEEK